MTSTETFRLHKKGGADQEGGNKKSTEGKELTLEGKELTPEGANEIIAETEQRIEKIHLKFIENGRGMLSEAQSTETDQPEEAQQFKIELKNIGEEAKKITTDAVFKLNKLRESVKDPRIILEEHGIKNPADNFGITIKLYRLAKLMNFNKLVEDKIITIKDKNTIIRGFTEANRALGNSELFKVLAKITDKAPDSTEKQKFVEFLEAVKEIKKESRDAHEFAVKKETPTTKIAA